jgi:hypothetical protein
MSPFSKTSVGEKKRKLASKKIKIQSKIFGIFARNTNQF